MIPSRCRSATIDLRIGYLKVPEPGQLVIAKATCYKLPSNAAEIGAVAYQADPGDPVVHAVGTFLAVDQGGQVVRLLGVWC